VGDETVESKGLTVRDGLADVLRQLEDAPGTRTIEVRKPVFPASLSTAEIVETVVEWLELRGIAVLGVQEFPDLTRLEVNQPDTGRQTQFSGRRDPLDAARLRTTPGLPACGIYHVVLQRYEWAATLLDAIRQACQADPTFTVVDWMAEITAWQGGRAVEPPVLQTRAPRFGEFRILWDPYLCAPDPVRSALDARRILRDGTDIKTITVTDHRSETTLVEFAS
jgi:hypothetical protein